MWGRLDGTDSIRCWLPRILKSLLGATWNTWPFPVLDPLSFPLFLSFLLWRWDGFPGFGYVKKNPHCQGRFVLSTCFWKPGVGAEEMRLQWGSDEPLYQWAESGGEKPCVSLTFPSIVKLWCLDFLVSFLSLSAVPLLGFTSYFLSIHHGGTNKSETTQKSLGKEYFPLVGGETWQIP